MLINSYSSGLRPPQECNIRPPRRDVSTMTFINSFETRARFGWTLSAVATHNRRRCGFEMFRMLTCSLRRGHAGLWPNSVLLHPIGLVVLGRRNDLVKLHFMYTCRGELSPENGTVFREEPITRSGRFRMQKWFMALMSSLWRWVFVPRDSRGPRLGGDEKKSYRIWWENFHSKDVWDGKTNWLERGMNFNKWLHSFV